MKRFRWILLTVTIALIVPAMMSSVFAEPKHGGTLKIVSTNPDGNCLGYPPEVRLLNELTYTYPCIEPLLRYNEKGFPAPNLATGWEIAKDLKSITFFLRKGVKFHDGTEFNAEAVKINYDLYRAGNRPEFRSVNSIDIVDRYTVRLNLTTFNNALLSNLAQYCGLVVSPTAIEKMGKDGCCKDPVGTGPFKFVSWEHDASIKFEKFDGYWQKGKPYVDAIEWILIKDPMTALAFFKSGDADIIVGVRPADAAALEATGKYKVKYVKQYVAGFAGDSGHPNSPFAKLRVRQAVSHAIDKRAIVDNILHGFAYVTNQAASPNSWGYNKDVKGYPYNPEKAKKLLTEAGYPQGFKTKIIGVTSSPYKEVCTAVQGYLSEVGIHAEVELLDFGGWFEAIMKGWENSLMFILFGQTVQDDSRNPESNISGRSPYFVSLLHPEETDGLLLKALETPDFERKMALTHEYNKLWTDKYAGLNFIWIQTSITVENKSIHDSGLSEIAASQFNPADVFIKE